MDIFATVTDRIIAEAESGIIPWNRPWTGVSEGAIPASNGKPYSLINRTLARQARRVSHLQAMQG